MHIVVLPGHPMTKDLPSIIVMCDTPVYVGSDDYFATYFDYIAVFGALELLKSSLKAPFYVRAPFNVRAPFYVRAPFCVLIQPYVTVSLYVRALLLINRSSVLQTQQHNQKI